MNGFQSQRQVTAVSHFLLSLGRRVQFPLTVMAIKKIKTLLPLLPRWFYSQCGDGLATGAAFPLATNAKTYRYFFLAQTLDSLLKTRWIIFFDGNSNWRQGSYSVW